MILIVKNTIISKKVEFLIKTTLFSRIYCSVCVCVWEVVGERGEREGASERGAHL